METVPSNLTGGPMARIRPNAACSTSPTIPRATDCGWSSISSTLRTGPAGTPAASSSSTHSAVGRRAKHRPRISTSAARLVMRPAFSRKRSSARRPGSSSTSTRRSQLAWLDAPRLIHPSAVSKVS